MQVIWDKIRSGSKIKLLEDKTLKGMNGEPRALKAGSYFITGFWGDMCGLNQTNPNGLNEVCIFSPELSNFIR